MKSLTTSLVYIDNAQTVHTSAITIQPMAHCDFAKSDKSLYEPIEYNDADATAAFCLLQADISAVCRPAGTDGSDEGIGCALQRRASRSAEEALISRGHCDHPAWDNLVADIENIFIYRSQCRAGVDAASFERLRLFVDENIGVEIGLG